VADLLYFCGARKQVQTAVKQSLAVFGTPEICGKT
jgi:hypothetical protein